MIYLSKDSHLSRRGNYVDIVTLLHQLSTVTHSRRFFIYGLMLTPTLYAEIRKVKTYVNRC